MFLEEERMPSSKKVWRRLLSDEAGLSQYIWKGELIKSSASGKRQAHLPYLADKTRALSRELEMWGRRLGPGNADSFEDLGEFAETSDHHQQWFHVAHDTSLP